MTPQRWSRTKEVFGAAFELPKAERSAFLDSACGGDAQLRAQVQRLLEEGDDASLNSPAIEILNAAELAPGDTVGHYRIESKLGEGGMGVVYKASDTRLRRSVALKFVKEGFNRRSGREARAVAALNHPNICTLYDVGPNYLAMELIEGPSLAERIAKGPIPPKEALAVGRQIAEALEAAHEKGIVHRDLKPANIKLTAEGQVKVLDFGLAKVQEPGAGGSEEAPTLTVTATEAGMILGTAAYMSPEQAGGKPIDKRADIWSFGVVLWELLTGHRLFEGETLTQTLAEVLRGPIDFVKLPPETPLEIRRLLRRCLDRDVKNRLRDIGEARIAIEVALAGDAPLEGAPDSGSGRRLRLAWSIAAVATVGLVTFVFLHFRERRPAPVAPMRFQIPAPGNAMGSLSLSPDGRKLAFSTGGWLWVHFLESGESRDLRVVTSGVPFWSPDSRFIGYPSGGKLRKIEATGGPPQTITELVGNVWAGAAWNLEDVIVFGDRRIGLFRVPASGGIPVQITALDPARHENNQFGLSFLADGRHFVYIRASTDEGKNAIYLGSVDAKPEQQSSKPLVASNTRPWYAPSADPSTGYLLFMREGTLMAQPFDNRRLELKGEVAPVVEQFGDSYPAFSASTDVLAFQRGAMAQLTWFDREGKVMGTTGEQWEQGLYANIALSPDERHLAVTKATGPGATNIWLLDLSPGGASTRFTFGSTSNGEPVWSPDGNNIVFSSNRDGRYNLYQKPAKGEKAEEVLLKSSEDKRATSWSRDGRFLLYQVDHPKNMLDIWVLPLNGDRKPVPFLITEFNERQARFSPDGHFVAYTSNESGHDEVYVRSFSMSAAGTAVEASGKWLISNGFGVEPHWRGDGRELYYRSPGAGIRAVEIATNPAFRAGNPHPLGLWSSHFADKVANSQWDSAADGKRFLGPALTGGPQPYTVVLNWQAGLKK